MILFPTSLDLLTNPTATSDTNLVSHADQHSNANDAIEALETKVGINNSAVATSIDYLLKSTSSSNPGHKHTLANGATDVTASAAELNYVKGVTSDIQTQLNTLNSDKAPIASPTFTGTVTLPTALSGIAKLTSGVVSAVTAPSGTIVGTTDSQTLTNKVQVAKVASYSPAGAGTTTLDLSTGGVHVVTMPAATQTLALSNETIGQFFVVEINNVTSQGALTWFTTIKWAGGTTPTLTGTNGKKDTFGFRVTSAGNYDGYIVGQNV